MARPVKRKSRRVRAATLDEVDENLTANDAIPLTGISFSSAHQLLSDSINSQEEVETYLDDNWIRALKKSKRFELKVNDPEAFDEEIAHHWHLRKVANVLLRLAIERHHITACIRDPETGDLLRLSSNEWLPDEWEDYIPSMPGSHVIPGDYESPGPAATLVRDALRPVFFDRSEFFEWMAQIPITPFTLEVSLKKIAALPNAEAPPKRTQSDSWKRHKRDAAAAAIIEIYGPVESLAKNLKGIAEGRRYIAVNKHLKDSGKDGASESTIRRARRSLLERS